MQSVGRSSLPPLARSSVDAVLFDYGRTLVTFEYPTDDLLEVLRTFRPRIAEALGRRPPTPKEILKKVLLPLEDEVASTSEDEVDYMSVFGAAWKDAGLDLPRELLYEILDAEQLCWDRAAQVDPDALQILSWLGARGFQRALCSNAPFPPAMMRRQVDANGVGELVDVVVFSSQVGRRKPAPEIYHATLRALGVVAERALFVGDRVREDYDGPLAVGMTAVICTKHAAEPTRDGVPTIASLSELPGLL
jgi:HAD superfamily hydrolase (TIGR01509 family)